MMELFLGFYFGILSMILLYNLHWYRVTKDKSYLYYAIFKLFIIVVVLQNIQIIVIDKFFLILNANVIFVFILLFSREFLALNINSRRVYIIINNVIIFLLLCFAYSVINQHYSIYDLPYSLVLSPLILLGYFIYRKGFKPAKYYMIAWGISLALVGLSNLNEYKIAEFYPEIPFTLIGHIIESIILSYAITAKTNLLIKEKEQQSKMLIHQSKLASMGQMLENISHQWHQPLNRIATYIINMQTYIENTYKTEGYLLEVLNQSQLQLEYMSNTINDFTEFNKQSKNRETFLASSVVDDVYNIVDQMLSKNNISFEMNKINDFSIFSYPNELAQVILNLVQNSQDILIKRHVKQPIIRVAIDENKISVQDNAGGIAVEIVDRIFEPYFTTNSKSSSLGLGLYISKMILEKHFNGLIEIEQAEQITSFNILFDAKSLT